MSILENLSDLAHELRCAAGTVLTILGSRLEARERARVECGPQWLTEFKEQRDSLEPQCACGAGYTSAAECPWCREVGDCICWVGHGDCSGCSGVVGISHEPACGWQWDPSCPQHGDGLKASAASALAADPSPTVPNAHSVVGDCPGSDSVILPTVEPGPQTSPTADGCGRSGGADSDTSSGEARQQQGDQPTPRIRCDHCDQFRPVAETGVYRPRGYLPMRLCHPNEGMDCYHLVTVIGETLGSRKPVPLVVAGESPREEEEQPSLGAAVTHEDLAAHLIGAAIRANTGHVDVLVEAFASSLLADFNITVREAARE